MHDLLKKPSLTLLDIEKLIFLLLGFKRKLPYTILEGTWMGQNDYYQIKSHVK